MDVLLTHGYFLHEDPKEQEIMRPYPPLGLLYISAYLSEHDIDNEVFDTTFSDKETFRKYLLENKPPIVALYTNLMTKLNVLEAIRFIKNHEALKRTKVVLGGPDLRYNKENYLQHGADYLVIGEGEQTMLELTQHLLGKVEMPVTAIDGIAYKGEKGQIITNDERQKLKAVDELSLPAREAIDMHKYLDVWKTHHGKSTLNISTQRGCPYTCRWCSTAVYGQSYRRRSPKAVVDELEMIREKYNPDALWFVDDVFTVSHKWLEAFKEELENRKVKIPFECITRADRLSESVLQTLKDCGCFRVWIGAESGSQKIIDAMDRRVKVEHVQEMINTAKAVGIETGTFIMLGYPGETEEDLKATIEHLKKSNPDHFTITVAYPIKGTGLYEEVEARMVNRPEWDNSTDRDIDFKRTFSRGYYDFAVRRVVNEVNYHKYRRLSNKAKSIAAQLGMWWEKQKAS